VKKVDTDIKKYLADPKNADNPIIIMAKSGARGNSSQIVQMVGMRGLMAKTFDYGRNNETHIVRDTIEAPVTSSFRDGLKVYEFFNSSYGARKSMSDVQMKTSKAGYMTRKLVDAAQEVVVNDEDCGSTTGLVVSAIYSDDGRTVMEKLSERITGRYTTKPVVDANGHELIGANQLITKAIAEAIENAGVTAVEIRSIIHCQCKTGVCQKCYGIDLSTTKEVKLNTAVGIVAAQSIGEPITQINLRSFHGGGVAGGPQISQGYERINQLFEVVEPKEHETAHLSPINGRVTEIVDIEDDEHKIVNKRITIASDLETVNVLIDRRLPPLVKVGDQVNVGTKLNIGSIRLNDLLAVAGVESVRQYIISEVQRLYCNQGIGVNDKYIEIIVNQMTNRFKITNAGASDLNVGEYIVDNRLADINNALLAKNLAPANGIPLIIGLSNIPANSDSFLAAASFQYTKRALIKAAIKNQVDELKTLKENVMLGQLIPVGTGKMRRDDLNKLGLETYKDEY
jgi:DNA-directed RNA polymerase subunit beta'